MINLKVKRLTETAKLPTYAHDGDACFDLYADDVNDNFGGMYLCDTGLSVEVPLGYAMMIYSRSGHGFKNNMRLANCVGVLDSGYRGPVMVKLTCDRQIQYVPKVGDRIAQAMLIPVPVVVFEEVTELSGSERGEGGFGSSGR